MLFQLEQKLSALNLVDTNGGILVQPLLETRDACVTGPNLGKTLSIYSMMAVAVSSLLAMLFEATAKTFRRGEEIQRTLNLPVLAHIPLDPKNKLVNSAHRDLDSHLSVVHRPYSPTAESIRSVRTAMVLDRRQRSSQVFQITSPLPGDGKSTIAANVGCSLAQTGQRTLLIDLDLRSPKLSMRFHLNKKPGLTNVLNGELNVADAVHRTPIEQLDVLPCGPLPSNPAEALTLLELANIFRWARETYDYIVVDTPPLMMVSDPTIVTTYVDTALLVMRIRHRCKPNAKEAVAMLRWSGTRVMGVVVNKIQAGKGFGPYRCSDSGVYQSCGYGDGDRYRRRYQQEVDSHETYVVRASATRRVDPPACERLGDSPERPDPDLQSHGTPARM